MKKLFVGILLVMMMAVSGCQSKTEYGPCVGAFDDKNPNL